MLFVDENFIVPVVCDADGRMHTMETMNYSGADDVQYLEGLTDFYRSATGISVIDTHFLFVESLDMNFRRKFISVLQKEGLNPVSFTCVPSVVLTDFAVAQGLTSPAVFGDSVIILYSSSDLLKVTGTVYDGNSWQWNAKVSVFDGVGDSPLKKAVVECGTMQTNGWLSIKTLIRTWSSGIIVIILTIHLQARSDFPKK